MDLIPIFPGPLTPPIIELPQNPTLTQVLYAAIAADNYSDKLMVEALIWRERSHDLFTKVDEMRGR
jgi:hypothetical protein